jgi:hypothetical protein
MNNKRGERMAQALLPKRRRHRLERKESGREELSHRIAAPSLADLP